MTNRISLSPIVLLSLMTVSMSAQPKAGDWKVPTRFGQFVISVNSTGTQITKLATTFSNYAFGGITQNGTVITLPSPGWPISNSQFAFTTSINPNGTTKLTLNGTFTPSGDRLQAPGVCWSPGKPIPTPGVQLRSHLVRPPNGHERVDQTRVRSIALLSPARVSSPGLMAAVFFFPPTMAQAGLLSIPA